MISLRRGEERRHVHHGAQDSWLTFFPRTAPGPTSGDFGLLTALDDVRLPPGEACQPRQREEAEIVSYLYRGALAQEDSTGSSGVIHTGEFQRMTLGRGVHHKETNPSHDHPAHLFRITLRPAEAGLSNAHEQLRFAAAQRRNLLCVVASPDGRRGSLRLMQDAVIYSSMLDPGHHLIHELLPGRSAWLHVIRGAAVLQDLILTAGDGVGLTQESSISVTAQQETELLLVDLGPVRRSFARDVVP
jgi:hypothetical protein